MTTRYDAVAAREYEQNGEKKTAFTNIGVAFPMRDRDGFSLRLHCLPAPVDGEYTILLFPPKPNKPKDDTRESRNARDRADPRTQRGGDMDDEIPF